MSILTVEHAISAAVGSGLTVAVKAVYSYVKAKIAAAKAEVVKVEAAVKAAEASVAKKV